MLITFSIIDFSKALIKLLTELGRANMDHDLCFKFPHPNSDV